MISPADGAGYFVGDNLQLAIGGGLFAASPLQLVNGYSTFANGGDHLQPRVAAAVLAPGTPTSTPGVVDLTQAIQQVIARTSEPMPLYVLGAMIYIAINFSLSALSRRLEARYAYIRE